MGTRLYVGNLDLQITSDDLTLLFAGAGHVVSAHIVIDRETKRSKGFGFVEMANEDEARHAIALYQGNALGEQSLIVSAARPAETGPAKPAQGPSPRFREVKHKRRGGADRHRFH